MPPLAATLRSYQAHHRVLYDQLQAELAAEAGGDAPAEGDAPRLLTFEQYLHLAALTARARYRCAAAPQQAALLTWH